MCTRSRLRHTSFPWPLSGDCGLSRLSYITCQGILHMLHNPPTPHSTLTTHQPISIPITPTNPHTNMSQPKRIVHLVTNKDSYAEPHQSEPTGLWLSELTHAWDVFAEKGYTQTLVSPAGGAVPIEPKSTAWLTLDASGKAWQADETKMNLLKSTKAAADVDPSEVDAIYLTGGHAVMFDFNEPQVETLIRKVWEKGGVVSSVCHGYCGLLDVKLTDGSYLINGKKLTGFSWNEECLAGVSKIVPYNAEERSRERGATYEKNLLPFTSNAVTDGKLVTGQNPQSAAATAEAVVKVLEG